MAEITRIVIKGSSGFCCIEEAYTDKVTITPDSISYVYDPNVESELNPRRKWSYKTNSPLFKKKYAEIIKIIPKVIKRDVYDDCTDVGGIEFDVIYADKTKFNCTYWVTGDDFKELFAVIKSIVPKTEYIPAVLLTSADYEDKEFETHIRLS